MKEYRNYSLEPLIKYRFELSNYRWDLISEINDLNIEKNSRHAFSLYAIIAGIKIKKLNEILKEIDGKLEDTIYLYKDYSGDYAKSLNKSKKK